MIEIYNNKSYKQYIFLVTLILLAGLAILLIVRPKNIGVSLGLFIFLEIVFLSRRFTDKISVVENNIVIAYYKWGFRRLLEFDIKNIRAEVGKIVENRGYKNKSLNIFYKNKLAYTFNTSDGFNDEDIDIVEEQISQQSGLQKT
ncbi:hypothetical protein Q4E93_19220 [Flavitalea sp. BT771]|uniref:hypothetical protein n=1 Tax=Flavitalea sp. BT771 TaxID=3063329 RepID=UPI0026E2D7AB|nr:hypothetical protein [Flavitalea sp. BT771]MDO6432746.1 hypothetical protein [Flavitalea sp. BT771]MDV6221978.1 hypothetical protein [Flavitalea sp. BT771]